jgi:hypothetical protein
MDIKPDFVRIYRDQNKEFRQYSGYLVATAQHTGTYGEATASAFNKIEEYFSGHNSENKKFQLMRPVFHRKEGTHWVVSVILPKGYELNSAPVPLDPSVSLKKIPPQKVAVLEYADSNNIDCIKARELELLKWLGSQTDFAPVSNGRVAEYDAPYGIPFLNRNEILIDVRIV